MTYKGAPPGGRLTEFAGKDRLCALVLVAHRGTPYKANLAVQALEHVDNQRLRASQAPSLKPRFDIFPDLADLRCRSTTPKAVRAGALSGESRANRCPDAVAEVVELD
ncbi:hypothetical protein O4H52_22200 [Sphingomonadaceae bacterium G21617-S1]|uniref:Uncharacterized protein n=1 Tax=Rhizorhabdus wittichii TaxID=160791 RepID=A0A975HGV5_9SPHN|nr:hypothetical protein [Rhizorhabdus wittichii]MCZ4344317.1 hypothetical protein [Sphingomonadaceae bacterium G21617-S1]QTH24852.1 hypothetical protein HRJ34_27645 [Rhizorhabdus wittichii]QUM74579.1 hypothetical protein ICN83_20100 [Sphingopyxis granuli]